MDIFTSGTKIRRSCWCMPLYKKKMRIKLLVLCFVLLNCFAALAQKKLVKVVVLARPSYCGGARPSEEMLAEMTKTKPYANKKMYLVSEKGKVRVVKTGMNGSFSIKLAEGTYKLMEAWKHKKASPNGGSIEHFDKPCLKTEWEKEALQIAVLKNEIMITDKNEITLYCDWAYPCLLEGYRQPMPE